MGLFRRSEPTASAAPVMPFVGAYGKLPNFGDFVNVRAHLEPAASFQTWLASAVHWAERRQLPGWPTVFDSEPLAFAFRPPSLRGGALVGVVRGSRDAVGRRFPFAIFTSIASDALSVSPHIVPLMAEAFLEAASTLLNAAPRVSSLAEIEALVQGLPPIGAPGPRPSSHYDALGVNDLARQVVWRDFGAAPRTDRRARCASHGLRGARSVRRRRDAERLSWECAFPSAQRHRLPWRSGWTSSAEREGSAARCRRSAGRRGGLQDAPMALVSLGQPHPLAFSPRRCSASSIRIRCFAISRAPTPGAGGAPLRAASVRARSRSRRDLRGSGVTDLLGALARSQAYGI